MKVVILAGGFGSRLLEETYNRPKPMIEIGQNPILWHIMKMYSSYGFNDFVICLGYKGQMIKDYFTNYFIHNTNLTIDIKKNTLEFHDSCSEPWRISLIYTGLNTMTGGRIKRIENMVSGERFMLTYGDGLSDVDIIKLNEFHKKNNGYATLTAVQTHSQFGVLSINKDNKCSNWHEKPKEDSWINAGFFVLENEIFDYIDSDYTSWEKEPLQNLSKDNKLSAYKHYGFWKCMDTLKDKNELNKLWNSDKSPWKIWE